jgi:hypothetical protein
MAVLSAGRRSRISLLVFLLMALASLATAPTTRAVCIGDLGPGAYVVFRAGSEGQVHFNGLTHAEVIAKTTEMESNGWFVDSLDGWAFACGTGLLYTVVFKEGSISQRVFFNLKRADFEAKNLELRGQGWRMVLIDTQVVNGVVTFNGIFHKSTVTQGEYFAWKRSEFEAENLRMRAAGFRMISVDTYSYDGNPIYYNAIFRKTSREQIDYFGWKAGDFVNEYNARAPEGWRVVHIDGGYQGVSASMIKIWGAERLRIMPIDDFTTQADDMSRLGWRIWTMSTTR